MDSIGLIQLSFRGHILEQEGDEGRVVFGCQGGIDRVEFAYVIATEVGSGSHACDQEPDIGMGQGSSIEDGFEIRTQLADALPTQHVIRTELEYQCGNRKTQEPVEAAQTPGGRIATHARVDYTIIEAERVDSLLDQRRKGLILG